MDLDLSGRWHATRADDELRRTWLDEDGGGGDWEPIDVPGHWRSTPAFAGSDGPLLHRTRFGLERPAPGERSWLVFDGCFYQGDVWLDGAYVGDTEGYFFPHSFEVTTALADRTEHALGVELACPRPSDLTSKRTLTGAFQHSHLLDPDWNPGGIWRPVRLESSGPVRIRHLRVLCREATDERAVVVVRAVLDARSTGEVQVTTTVAGVDAVEPHTLAEGENQLTWSVTVPDPDLWWPHVLGDQPLHDVVVEVQTPETAPVDAVAPDDDAGAWVRSDRRVRRVGLRQIVLRDWVASVNGERLFLKGSNLAPTCMALGEASPEDVRRDVSLAVDAGLDLLRVHAHISRPELYDAADEAGILLWQDMPLQWTYARSVRRQAVRQAREAVDVLGHHPSIVIWCGHNEPFPMDLEPGSIAPLSLGSRFTAQQLPSWNRSVLDASIKRALHRNDGTRPVVAHSGVLPHPPRLDGTDSHLSFGWGHGDHRDLAGFARMFPRAVRFVSELGAQAVPESDDFLDVERWPDLDWDRLGKAHGMHLRLFDLHVAPRDHRTYEEWQAATQRYQAVAIRRCIEQLRRLKYQPTGGFAQMFLADAHPGVTASVLDHRRVPKAGWEALRAACAPVIVVADLLPDAVTAGDPLALDVHVVSDRREPIEGLEVTASMHWTDGDNTWRFGGDVPADACLRVGTIQLVVPEAPGPLTLTLRLVGPDGEEMATNDDTTVVAPRG